MLSSRVMGVYRIVVVDSAYHVIVVIVGQLCASPL